MDKATLDQLAAQEHKAEIRLRKLQAKQSEARDNTRRAAYKIIDVELDRVYGPSIKYAREDLQVAARVHTQAREEYASTGAGAPAPLGTIYKEWAQEGGSYWSGGNAPRRRVLTGRRARLEAITSSSAHPNNTKRHANIGTYVLRLLKKDGTPSLQYLSLGRYLFGSKIEDVRVPAGWYAAGVNPNATQPKE